MSFVKIEHLTVKRILSNGQTVKSIFLTTKRI